MGWIGQEVQRRAALGKASQPCLHQRPLSPERVDREIKRHTRGRRNCGNRMWTRLKKLPYMALTRGVELVNPSPRRISLRTPPSAAPSGSPDRSHNRTVNPLTLFSIDVPNTPQEPVEGGPEPRAGSVARVATPQQCEHTAAVHCERRTSSDVGRNLGKEAQFPKRHSIADNQEKEHIDSMEWLEFVKPEFSMALWARSPSSPVISGRGPTGSMEILCRGWHLNIELGCEPSAIRSEVSSRADIQRSWIIGDFAIVAIIAITVEVLWVGR